VRARLVQRTPDEKPDLSGVWQVLNSAAFDIEDHNAEPGVPAGAGVVVGGEIPYQPSALEQRKRNHEISDHRRYGLRKCYLPGGYRAFTYMPYPFRIIQTPERIDIMLRVTSGRCGHIFKNSPHPRGPIEWWMGDSSRPLGRRPRWSYDRRALQRSNALRQGRGTFHSVMLQRESSANSFIDPTHLKL
jgi:hypothetical protein